MHAEVSMSSHPVTLGSGLFCSGGGAALWCGFFFASAVPAKASSAHSAASNIRVRVMRSETFWTTQTCGERAPPVARAAARGRAVDDRLAVDRLQTAEGQHCRADLAEAVEQLRVVGDRPEELERLDLVAAHQPPQRVGNLRLIGRLQRLHA